MDCSLRDSSDGGEGSRGGRSLREGMGIALRATEVLVRIADPFCKRCLSVRDEIKYKMRDFDSTLALTAKAAVTPAACPRIMNYDDTQIL